MNRKELEMILPHRDNMLLLDEAYVEDGVAIGRYKIRGDEFFLQGHFPGNPVVPGVILCEMMAQTTAVLLTAETEGSTPYFTSLNNVRFKNVVRPGDTIELRSEITKTRPPFYFAKGEGFVSGKLSVSGEFSFAIK
ncbi:MAG: beta-hydroxyacyl-ACP dehydratase [Clostridiales bacterium]|jgi:3-hydroxyacyl-[acyl-carrier-protein] dehydratase|nr:beta-hydroxyacyl-ACP dehydratase [Clostridiales bacterium]